MDRLIRRKNVSMKQLVKILIISVCFFVVAFIPVSITPKLVFLYQFLPLVGEPLALLTTPAIALEELITIIGAQSVTVLVDILGGYCFAFMYSFYVFFGILAANILFSLLLMITRCNAIRVICKIFSIIFGIASILMAIIFGLYIIVLITQAFMGANILSLFFEQFGIVAIVLFILTIILSKKQFKWYGRP